MRRDRRRGFTIDEKGAMNLIYLFFSELRDGRKRAKCRRGDIDGKRGKTRKRGKC